MDVTFLLEKQLHSPGEPEALCEQRYPPAERVDSRVVPQGTRRGGEGRLEDPKKGLSLRGQHPGYREKRSGLLWVTLWISHLGAESGEDIPSNPTPTSMAKEGRGVSSFYESWVLKIIPPLTSLLEAHDWTPDRYSKGAAFE